MFDSDSCVIVFLPQSFISQVTKEKPMNPWRLMNGYYEKRNRGQLPKDLWDDGMKPDEWPNSYVPLGLYEAFETVFLNKRQK